MISRFGRRFAPLVAPFKHSFKTNYAIKSTLTYLQNNSFSTTAPEIKSTPGNKPPQLEESPHGRYASVLFFVASQNEVLHLVNNDVIALKELYTQSEEFRNFIFNLSFKRTQQTQVFQSLYQGLELNKVTQDFLDTLIENKRVQELPKVLDKYVDYYKILNKEENITIISAQELNENDKKRVVEALKTSQKGVTFTLKYKVDPAILGGLQMYSGNRFMDASLASRVTKIKGELQKLTV